MSDPDLILRFPRNTYLRRSRIDAFVVLEAVEESEAEPLPAELQVYMAGQDTPFRFEGTELVLDCLNVLRAHFAIMPLPGETSDGQQA